MRKTVPMTGAKKEQVLIYTHLDFNSKVASAQAIMGFFPSDET